ncbi:MAG: hypothetical protein FWC77_05315 [Defluviitaleaceae bacterium]|nr:hypothetical protein [Defluviitaleaceae bacterium]
MAKNSKSKSRDLTLLKKIREVQNMLRDGLSRYDVRQHNDLQKDPIIRSGLIYTVSRIFELSKALRDETNARLSWDGSLIKVFRNNAVHKYDSLNNAMAFACIRHCISKELINGIDAIIVEFEDDEAIKHKS